MPEQNPHSGPVPAPDDGWSRSWRLTRARLADQVPVALRDRRPVPPAAAAAAVGVACSVLLGAGARWMTTADAPGMTRIAPVGAAATTTSRPTEPVGPSAAVLGPTAAGADPAAAVPGTVAAPGTGVGQVVVDVVGQVRTPGIVRLPTGSRVVDAVEAAGGAGPHAALELVNLARPLVDGEQIVVPRPGDPVPPGANGSGAGTGSAAGPAAAVDLNVATESQLDELPGIGPVLAGRIVSWRGQHGRFSTVDELAEVGGIGDRLLEQLRPLVRV